MKGEEVCLSLGRIYTSLSYPQVVILIALQDLNNTVIMKRLRKGGVYNK